MQHVSFKLDDCYHLYLNVLIVNDVGVMKLYHIVSRGNIRRTKSKVFPRMNF